MQSEYGILFPNCPRSLGSEVGKISQRDRQESKDMGLGFKWVPDVEPSSTDPWRCRVKRDCIMIETLTTHLRWTQENLRARENVVCLPECSAGDQVSSYSMVPEQKTSNG